MEEEKEKPTGRVFIQGTQTPKVVEETLTKTATPKPQVTTSPKTPTPTHQGPLQSPNTPTIPPPAKDD